MKKLFDIDYKDDFIKIKDYLIDNYYKNPNHYYTKEEIKINNNLSNNIVINEILEYLKDNNYIKMRLNGKFKVKYEGIRKLNENNVNKTNILISGCAMMLSMISFISTLLLEITMEPLKPIVVIVVLIALYIVIYKFEKL